MDLSPAVAPPVPPERPGRLPFAPPVAPVQAPGGGVSSLCGPVCSVAPEELHPALWRAHQLGRSRQAVTASGFDELDAQLPGGGWPAGVVTELMLPHPGVGELRLLAPALAALQQQQRSVFWFDPPAAPCAWTLAALGLDLRQLVLVRAHPPSPPPRPSRPSRPGSFPGGRPEADLLWALEQALKSGHLGAVLAWLPARLPPDALRRLQLAAQSHPGPAFLLRGDEARLRPSAAPLRIGLASGGADALRLTLLKRRGPPLAQPLTLALPPVLSAPALVRAQRGPAAPAEGATWPIAGQRLPA